MLIALLDKSLGAIFLMSSWPLRSWVVLLRTPACACIICTSCFVFLLYFLLISHSNNWPPSILKTPKGRRKHTQWCWNHLPCDYLCVASKEVSSGARLILDFNQSPKAPNHASVLGNGKPFYKHLGRKHRQGHFWWTAVVKHSSRWTAASGTWCASTPGRQNRDSSQKKWSSEARTWALVQKALKILCQWR